MRPTPLPAPFLMLIFPFPLQMSETANTSLCTAPKATTLVRPHPRLPPTTAPLKLAATTFTRA